MIAHSEYCAKGDHTIEAIRAATISVANPNVEADDHFVFSVRLALFTFEKPLTEITVMPI